MTATPKWAFIDKGGAQQFIAAYGGRLATFDEALALAGD
jgi:nitrous oxide reductase accessory protein NosL